jgi:hypothetical protein
MSCRRPDRQVAVETTFGFGEAAVGRSPDGDAVLDADPDLVAVLGGAEQCLDVASAVGAGQAAGVLRVGVGLALWVGGVVAHGTGGRLVTVGCGPTGAAGGQQRQRECDGADAPAVQCGAYRAHTPGGAVHLTVLSPSRMTNLPLDWIASRLVLLRLTGEPHTAVLLER